MQCLRICGYPSWVHQVAPVSYCEYPQRPNHLCWCIFTTWGHLRITKLLCFFSHLSKSQTLRNYFPLHLSGCGLFFPLDPDSQEMCISIFSHELSPHGLCPADFCCHKALTWPQFQLSPGLCVRDISVQRTSTRAKTACILIAILISISRTQNAFSQPFPLILPIFESPDLNEMRSITLTNHWWPLAFLPLTQLILGMTASPFESTLETCGMALAWLCLPVGGDDGTALYVGLDSPNHESNHLR